MHLTIEDFTSFTVSFRLHNILGEVDGHPRVVFNMATGDYRLYRDKTFCSLVSMVDDPHAGEEFHTIKGEKTLKLIDGLVRDRVTKAAFHDDWATKRFNLWNKGDSYDRGKPREERRFGHNYLFFRLPDITEMFKKEHYDQLEDWYQKLPENKQNEEAYESICYKSSGNQPAYG